MEWGFLMWVISGGFGSGGFGFGEFVAKTKEDGPELTPRPVVWKTSFEEVLFAVLEVFSDTGNRTPISGMRIPCPNR